MQQQIGRAGLFQRGAKSRYQVVRQVPDTLLRE